MRPSTTMSTSPGKVDRVVLDMDRTLADAIKNTVLHNSAVFSSLSSGSLNTVFDEEGVRWGRFYRTAGFYSEILLWIAFALWLLANILFFLTLHYAAYVLGLCGACMIGATLVWSNVRNPFELMIPFTDKDILKFSHGGSFWICMTSGILSIVIAFVVWIVNWKSPLTAATFLDLDVPWNQRKDENDNKARVQGPKGEKLQLKDIEGQQSGKKVNNVTKSRDDHIHNDWGSDVEYYSEDDLPPTDEENNDDDYSSDNDNDDDNPEMTTLRVTPYGLVIPRSKAGTKVLRSSGTLTNTRLTSSLSDASATSSGIGSITASISGTSNASTASTRVFIPMSEGGSIRNNRRIFRDGSHNGISQRSTDGSITQDETADRYGNVGRTPPPKDSRSPGAGNVWTTRESTWFPKERRKRDTCSPGVKFLDRQNQISPV